MVEFWNEFLYRPLFNLLIWLYNNYTDHNLGWAVVYLTILLRLALLPFSIIAERNKIRNDRLLTDINRIDKAFRNDQVAKKEEIRKILKHKKVQPWAKAFELGVQVLVLVLLYQVFVGGIVGEKVTRSLYYFVNFPGKINSVFYGFNLGQNHDILWAGIVGLFLLVEIYLDYSRRKVKLSQGDLAYFILFPLFSFYILWLLPMVKSLFILTTLIFSVIIHGFTMAITSQKKEPEKAKK